MSAVADPAAVAIDGGLGAAAVAAIAARPDGPQRDLEIATWTRAIVRAIRAGNATIVFSISNDREERAMHDLNASIHRAGMTGSGLRDVTEGEVAT